MAAGRCGGRRGGAELTISPRQSRATSRSSHDGREREEETQEDQQEIDQGAVDARVRSGGFWRALS